METAEAFLRESPNAHALARMARQGFALGWHEANGGNASLRLSADELQAVRAFCDQNALEAGAWQPLAVQVPALAGSAFLLTAAGSFMGELAEDPAALMGVAELDGAGERFRVLLGFSGGGRPTSEFAGHLLIHEALRARDERARVLYHAHPDALIALSKLLPAEPREVTRALWRATTECIMAVPEGVGAVPCLVPGSLELARASAEQMRSFRAVLWAQHGLLCSGYSCDDAFGRMHSLAKAANVQLLARAAAGSQQPGQVPDEVLRAMDEQLHLGANVAFLSATGK